MKLTIDTDANELIHVDVDGEKRLSLYSAEAFELVSEYWLKLGWNEKYVYTFSWFGRPVIQLPDDMLRIQEVIYAVKPDVIVETGVAHGGSLIFYASLCKAMEKGRIIGIDIEIRPHNRKAIEVHELSSMITLIEGDSTAPGVVAEAKEIVGDAGTVLVLLDSNHSRDHVGRELEAYCSLVSLGSYIVATDGSMEILHDVPRGDHSWKEDNPKTAAADFATRHPEFELAQPNWPFNESKLSKNVTHWPGAWLRRIK